MTISVKMICDSISPDDIRISTFQLRYPRFIHAEFMTHRMFSRNASSSRAVPVKRLIEDILRDTVIPMHWGRNIPGMQAREETDEYLDYEFSEPRIEYDLNYDTEIVWDTDTTKISREEAWLMARDNAIKIAKMYDAAGYHKQIVNRLLEPFSHINVLVTSTSFDNFYGLRIHPDAQPEINMLAEQMYNCALTSSPKLLQHCEWHLPYITDDDIRERNYFYFADIRNPLEISSEIVLDDLRKLSVARCARVSYLTHDNKKPDIKKDLELYEKLIVSEPLHASPAEHQATPDRNFPIPGWESPHLHGNFDGWIQFRKSLPNEQITKYNRQ